MLPFFLVVFLSHRKFPPFTFYSPPHLPPSTVTSLVAATTVWRSPRIETWMDGGFKHVILEMWWCLKYGVNVNKNLPNTSFRDDHFNDHDWVGENQIFLPRQTAGHVWGHHLPTLQPTRLSTSQAPLALRKTKLSAEKVLLQEVGKAFATFRPWGWKAIKTYKNP